MHYAVTHGKNQYFLAVEMEKASGFVLAMGIRFTSVKASDRQKASLDSRSDLRKGTLTKQ